MKKFYVPVGLYVRAEDEEDAYEKIRRLMGRILPKTIKKEGWWIGKIEAVKEI